jgi:hypothetical protein
VGNFQQRWIAFVPVSFLDLFRAGQFEQGAKKKKKDVPPAEASLVWPHLSPTGAQKYPLLSLVRMGLAGANRAAR